MLGAKKILGKQRMVEPKVVTKKVTQHVADRPQSEGYKDGWHAEGRAGQRKESWYTTDSYADGCPQDNSSTKRTDFGLSAMKTYGNAESRTRAKMSPSVWHTTTPVTPHLSNW